MDRRDIFGDDADREQYLGLIGDATRGWDWQCLAYCLMPNHSHLLVEASGENLGLGIQAAHGTYAAEFNRRYDRSGHLFQGRYGSVQIRDDVQLWIAAAYIALNPVEGGLAPRAEEFAWSSHGALAAGTAPGWLASERLDELFSALGGDGRRRYLDFVDDRLAIRRPDATASSAARC